MEPVRLSASSIKCFEDCEVMFRAHYIDQVREGSGAAASLGTDVHTACEKWVQAGCPADVDFMIKLFDADAVMHGLDKTMLSDGRKMIREFYDRWMANPPHEVLTTEKKSTFTIKAKGKEIEVTYIWDRGDRMPDGSIEVVDYKTWRKVLDAEDMRQLVQVRIYALSAAIEYKSDDPPFIWVTLDQMRTGPVSVKFNREDNAATWRYLKDVWARIQESEGIKRTINENCQYCALKADCPELKRAIDGGNIAKLRANPELAATRLAELKAARSAIDGTISGLEEFCEDLLAEHAVPIIIYPSGVNVKMTVRKNRKAEHLMINRVLGLDPSAKMSMQELDELLSGDSIDEDTKAQVKKYITTTASGRASAFFPKR
jgi:RecB family exonuclease